VIPLCAKWESGRSALAIGHRKRIATLGATRDFYSRSPLYRSTNLILQGNAISPSPGSNSIAVTLRACDLIDFC
jgi:hypothetical protein